MAKAPKAAKEITEEKSASVVVVNVGVSVIFIGGERVMPGDEISISEEALSTSGILYLISQESLEIKNDRDRTEEIREEVRARTKKDPHAGKSQKELEDGGEF